MSPFCVYRDKFSRITICANTTIITKLGGKKIIIIKSRTELL